jgi:hypothetical protein
MLPFSLMVILLALSIVTIVTENGVCRKVYSTFLAYRGYKYAAYRARRASCLTSVSCVSDVMM